MRLLSTALCAAVATTQGCDGGPPFDVTAFGARGDGTTLDTVAINRALAAAKDAGGGEVVFPSPGVYLTGALSLPSHLVLTVPAGAMVLGSPHEADYPTLPPMWSVCGRIVTSGPFASPLLGGRQVTNVSIRGGGVLDGGGFKSFKPRLIQFQRSQGVHIQNMTLQRSGMWTVHFYFVVDASVTDSRIINPILQSETDGIDIDSSANVYIARNFIQCGDDGISLKSGSDWCGRQWATPTVNVTIERNFFNFSGGQLAFGSDMSGGVRDVLVQHNTLYGDAHQQPHLFDWGPRVIVLKTGRGRGGVIENVQVLNTTCIDCDQIVRIAFDYVKMSSPQNMSATPIFRNVTVRGVHGTAEEPGFFRCIPESSPEMHFEDIDVQFLSTRHAFVGCGPNCPIGTAATNVRPSVCGLTPQACPAPSMVGSLSKGLWLQAGPPASPPPPSPPLPPPPPPVGTPVLLSLDLFGRLNFTTDATRFLSFTHDSGFVVDGVHQPQWTDSRLQHMVSALSPAFLRFGGSDMDFTEYDFPAQFASPEAGAERQAASTNNGASLRPASTGDYREFCGQSHSNKCFINASIWSPFLQFVGDTGLQLIAGLNALEGRGAGSPSSTPWDSSRSMQMIRWSLARHPGVLAGVELGNEPDDFGMNDTSVPSSVFGADFTHLRHLLNNGTPAMRDLFVWGPDVSYSKSMFGGILENIHTAGVLAANTYHSYYNQEAASISLQSFTDPAVMDSIVPKMIEFGALSKQYGNGAKLVLGETSTFSGGGAGTASDSFYAVFLFLDKLGLAARHGHSHVMYQCILDPVMNDRNQDEVTYEIIKEGVPNLQLGGYKALAGRYTPTPNFFASLFWKALMGPKVLAVSQAEAGRSKYLRSYAHCTQAKGQTNASLFLHPSSSDSYVPGSVVVLLINVGQAAEKVRVPQLCANTSTECTRDDYHLLPGATPPFKTTSRIPSYTVFNCTSNLAPDEKLPSTAVAGSTTGSAAGGYHITFLGNFSTWQGCRDNAAQRYKPLANSWTWFSTAAATAMALTCFAHRDGVWHPHTEAGAVAGNSTGWVPPPPPAPPKPEPADPLLSIGVLLNGSPLTLGQDGTIPMLTATAGDNASTVVVQAKSVVFVVFPNADATLCKTDDVDVSGAGGASAAETVITATCGTVQRFYY